MPKRSAPSSPLPPQSRLRRAVLIASGERAGKGSSPERVLDILLMFEWGETVSVRQVADRFGGSRSSTYRDLAFLKSRGFIEEGASPGTFQLGPVIERLANSAGGRQNLAKVARPHLQHLAEVSGESVLLCRRSGTRALVVAYADSPQMLRVSMQAADNRPLHSGSFAKLLLAYQRPVEIERILAQPVFQEAGALNTQALFKELAQIREQGYAASDSEVEVGARSVAVPVRGGDGMVLAALTIAAPASRFSWERLRELVPVMHQAAQDIVADWDD